MKYQEEQQHGVHVTTSNSDSQGYSDMNDEKKGVFVTTDEADETSDEMFHDRDAIMERIAISSDLDDLQGDDADFVVDKTMIVKRQEALTVLSEAIDYHTNDVNFPKDTLNKMRLLVQGEEAYGESPATYDLDLRLEAAMIKYFSPYPEIRSVCRPTDSDVVVETFRAYAVGLVWLVIGAFVNQIMAFRQPSFTLSSQVLQILIYPSGKLLQYILPKYKVGFGRFKIDLNPGPWNFKEQMFATIVTNAGAQAANFSYYGPTMRLSIFYGQTWQTFGFTVIMNFASQFFGYGLAGSLRRWAVYPVKAVWPTILPTMQLNRTLLTLEKKQTINGWSISKYKLFFILLWASLIYFFLPDFLFESLSTFNWMTWIAPQNKHLAYATGSLIGVGFNPIATWDWSVINYATPMVLPFFVTANRYAGTVLGAIILLIIFYTNFHSTAYMPPNRSTVYDRYGATYNTSAVLTNSKFNLEKYLEYSPPYVSAGQYMYQSTAYFIYTFAFAYVFINEWSTMKEAFVGFYQALRNRNQSAYARYGDPMSIMMRKYKEVPDWWYLLILGGSIAFSLVGVGAFPSDTPVWVAIVAILVSCALIIPFIVLYSTTGYFMSMNNLATILGGFMSPGSPLACIFCRIYGYSIDEQSETIIGDLKLGHYSRIPPRSVFRGQVIGIVIQCFVTAGVYEMLVASFDDFCSTTNKAKFTCTFAHTLYADSLLMGIVGPERTFRLYPMFKWAFLIGAVLGPLAAYGRKRFLKYLQYFHPVLFVGGIIRFGSTYNLTYYTSGFYVAYFFMYYIRRRYLTWWSKYNYIISSGLTAGVAFGGILIFLALQYHPVELTWWGNSVYDAGVDGAETATLKSLADGEYFGLREGTWD
ncbi:OPT oligopeptide transporter protein-domain-containing protein [Limtongia smithiae]|uniref:OPT oligopeptide transporter protein-domain-containing protein n=1 Tax=Limtongia smithiae TaxID=1125753 RepID=UPI0034CF37D3